MYIAICDDHIQELKNLQILLDKYISIRSLPIRYQMFRDAEEMLQVAQTEHFTHYFLDVIMPHMDGITAAQEIRSFSPYATLVFLSTSTEFAYQSYRVKAYDYLLKPIQEQQFIALLDQLQIQENRLDDCLIIQNGRSFIRLPFFRIAHLEINHKKLYFQMTDGQMLQIYGTLAEYEPMLLSRPSFVKIHRSIIINLHHILSLTPTGCIMISGKNLPISRLLYDQVRQRYIAHLFNAAEG